MGIGYISVYSILETGEAKRQNTKVWNHVPNTQSINVLPILCMCIFFVVVDCNVSKDKQSLHYRNRFLTCTHVNWNCVCAPNYGFFFLCRLSRTANNSKLFLFLLVYCMPYVIAMTLSKQIPILRIFYLYICERQ